MSICILALPRCAAFVVAIGQRPAAHFQQAIDELDEFEKDELRAYRAKMGWLKDRIELLTEIRELRKEVRADLRRTALHKKSLCQQVVDVLVFGRSSNRDLQER